MAIKHTQMKTRLPAGRQGFALLIAVIFVSVMLTFGLALSSLSYKQQVLSASAVQSQYAFYAADAGLECALYADQKENRFAYPPSAPSSAPAMVCAGSPPISPTFTYSGGQFVVYNRMSLDSGKRCAEVTVYKYSAPQAGNLTTFIYSQGYDVPCATVVSPPAGTRFVARGVSARY